jgi:hypothetical protein
MPDSNISRYRRKNAANRMGRQQYGKFVFNRSPLRSHTIRTAAVQSKIMPVNAKTVQLLGFPVYARIILESREI